MRTELLTNLKKALSDPAKSRHVFKTRHWQVWKNNLLRMFGHDDFKRFIILTRGRTGSNLLLSYLNSHPNVFAQGEIFSHIAQKKWQNTLASNFKKQPPNIKAYGFKIFYYHPLDCKGDLLWDRLLKDHDLYVIHLKRQNILRSVISGKIASQQKVWSTALPVDEKEKTYLSAKKLATAFKRTRHWEQTFAKRFSSHPTLDVYYEDLVSFKDQTYRKVTDFMDLAYVPPRTVLTKQNPEKARDLIENYDELKEIFNDTAWSAFFHE